VLVLFFVEPRRLLIEFINLRSESHLPCRLVPPAHEKVVELNESRGRHK
jgi:hypothetical protein